MNDLTYIIPTRIESEDRLRNIVTSVSYLLANFPEAKVIVKEVDKQSVFKQNALPTIENLVDTKNLRHIFEKSDDDLFHKTRILNDLILESETTVVASHDVDVVYPVSSHQTAYNAIISGNCDVVYPYGCGVYQYQVTYPVEVFETFLKSGFDLQKIMPHCRTEASTIGWTQFYNRKKVIEGYMWNEVFLSWGAEDCEFYYRFNALGYNVGRVDGPLWHFEHSRTHNSHYHNPKFMENHNLWQWIREQDPNVLHEYYNNQPYVKRRQSDARV
jgi:hypothetical protein